MAVAKKISAKEESQKRAFQFLLNKYTTQEAFTADEFQKATGWTDATFRTYKSKQFQGLLKEVGSNQFRVSHVFRRFATWDKFQNEIVSQNRRLAQEYKFNVCPNVLIFEFFMPLRNEEFLRDALDGLFYKDVLTTRLKSLDRRQLLENFPNERRIKEELHIEGICEWLSTKFVGYSIQHVSGRFRADALKTREESVKSPDTRKYLIDETTAIVRFIFPIAREGNVDKEVEKISWAFQELFVGSILEVVNGEDEIWLLETGLRNQLFIYSMVG